MRINFKLRKICKCPKCTSIKGKSALMAIWLQRTKNQIFHQIFHVYENTDIWKYSYKKFFLKYKYSRSFSFLCTDSESGTCDSPVYAYFLKIQIQIYSYFSSLTHVILSPFDVYFLKTTNTNTNVLVHSHFSALTRVILSPFDVSFLPGSFWAKKLLPTTKSLKLSISLCCLDG